MPPEDKPLEIELVSSAELCAGMVAAYVCRRIAHRAGTYAPGIHEHVFTSLRRYEFGSTIDGVTNWFHAASGDLFALGYKLCARRVAFRTPLIERWVGGGNGYRAAVMTTDGNAFHESRIRSGDTAHAVGLLLPTSPLKKPKLELVDPWPGVEHVRQADDRLEPAHRSRKYGTVLVFWTGHS